MWFWKPVEITLQRGLDGRGMRAASSVLEYHPSTPRRTARDGRNGPMINSCAPRSAQLALIGTLLFLVTAGGVAAQEQAAVAAHPDPIAVGRPLELRMQRAASTTLDLRLLPPTAPEKVERPEREPPEVTPVELPGGPPAPSAPAVPGRHAPGPSTIVNCEDVDCVTGRAVCR